MNLCLEWHVEVTDAAVAAARSALIDPSFASSRGDPGELIDDRKLKFAIEHALRHMRPGGAPGDRVAYRESEVNSWSMGVVAAPPLALPATLSILDDDTGAIVTLRPRIMLLGDPG